MEFKNERDFALALDAEDPLASYRQHFLFPQHKGQDCTYFCGNSLGLQPKNAREHILQELDDWAKFGVEGHFDAKNPWYSYHELFTQSAASLVGAKPEEVVMMNGLTTNLHLLMASFYRPKGKRVKILCESKAFPSDQYALDSQARFHGLNPEEVIVEVPIREGEHTIRMEDVLYRINELGDELALVMIGAVNYYSGQFFDLAAITKAGHAVGSLVGFDLAHAAGNVPLSLHDTGVDFAAWCSYKYLNSGPGSVAGAYVHERHLKSKEIPRFEGWWGHDKSERFKMERRFSPMPTAEAWQLSNAPVLAMAAHKASLELFDEVGMDALRAKSELLSAYLMYVVDDVAKATGKNLEIITPRDPEQRGSQVSIIAHDLGKGLFDSLTENGVVVDWREPNVIRMAAVPLYNSFADIQTFATVLKNAISS